LATEEPRVSIVWSQGIQEDPQFLKERFWPLRVTAKLLQAFLEPLRSRYISILLFIKDLVQILDFLIDTNEDG
jgi:hypothetical protein